MYWEDLLLDRRLVPAQLTEWLLGTFPVSEDSIVVAPERSRFVVAPETRVLCEYASVEGDFVMSVAIFTRHTSLDLVESEAAVARLCHRFSCRALTSDETVNPYRMILTAPTGRRRAIHLDVSALDDHDRFVIASHEDD